MPISYPPAAFTKIVHEAALARLHMTNEDLTNSHRIVVVVAVVVVVVVVVVLCIYTIVRPLHHCVMYAIVNIHELVQGLNLGLLGDSGLRALCFANFAMKM